MRCKSFISSPQPGNHLGGPDTPHGALSKGWVACHATWQAEGSVMNTRERLGGTDLQLLTGMGVPL